MGNETIASIERGASTLDALACDRSATPRETDQATIERLANLLPMEYDRIRKDEAEALGVRPNTLDQLVRQSRKGQKETLGLDDIDPWPHPVDPMELLSEVAATVRRFVVCSPETSHAIALWAAMTWLMDVVSIAPLAVITAPEKRCGKSQLLFLLGKLTRRPLTASSISPAAMFRAIDAWQPTLMVDEADAFMRDNEELRGIINAGHTRDSAYVVRVVGDDHTPQKFNVWGAKALAGIGQLSDTLMDRAIVLELRRKLPHEVAERLRHAEPRLFEILSEKLARFADDYRETVRAARPELPESLNDRAQDNWEPLLAIADIAGSEWSILARKAANVLSGTESPALTVGAELLADIREIFDSKRIDKISSRELIDELCADDEKPWATYCQGKPISARQVSRRLGEYGIRGSKTLRMGNTTVKGYDRDSFREAFARYLPNAAVTSVTPSQPAPHLASSVTQFDGVTETHQPTVTSKPAPPLNGYRVTDVTEYARQSNGE